MDIQYLLFLQDFRNGINDALTPFMEWISHFAVVYLLALPAIVYWCIDKKKGLYIYASLLSARMINAVIKLTACCYRPWIRDSRVIPAGDAMTEATGYSFPSGHTVTATPIYGGVAVAFGKKKKWLAAICMLLVLITGFSRNYLGVHTPQDVVVATLEGVLVLWGMYKLFHYLEEHPEKENLFLLAGVMITIVALVYITVKSYPMDYVNGELLVDPKKMMQDGYKDISTFGAFCIARFIEKNYIRFRATGVNAKGIVLTVVGTGLMMVISSVLEPALKTALNPTLGKTLGQVILVVFVVAIWPAILKFIFAYVAESD